MISFSSILFWPLVGIFLGRAVLGGSCFKSGPLEGNTEQNASNSVSLVVKGCVGHSAPEARGSLPTFPQVAYGSSRQGP